jgi:hypothetical protein
MKTILAISLLFSFVFVNAAPAAEWKTSFNADLEAEGLYWTEGALGPDTKTARGIFTAKAPSMIRYGRTWRLKALPVVQSDPMNVSKDEKFFWDMQEGYLQWQNLPWTVQLGMNVFNWGDTDVFNPLDVVNARRYFDPMRSEKLGAPALVIKRDFENFFVEGVYIPKQRKTLVPGENSRWLPRNVYRVRSLPIQPGMAARIVLPSNIRYTYADELEVDNALDNNFGLRLKFRLPNFDWTIAGFQGAALTPDVRLRRLTVNTTSTSQDLSLVTVTVDPDITLQAGYYPIRMTGTSFAWVLGSYLVKGTAAYTHTLNRRFDLPARTWENALGVERTFGLGKGSLTALLQATYVDRGDAIDTNTVSLARMFDRGVMGALRWAPNESWTVLASYLNDTKFKGELWHGEATYKIMDGWRAKLSADLLDGNTETPLGTYKRNDRATVSLLAQF